MGSTLRDETPNAPHMEIDPSRCTDRAVQNAMNGLERYDKVKTRNGVLWVIRDMARYASMSPAELAGIHAQQQRAWEKGELKQQQQPRDNDVNFF